jgi:hypothetical protein
MLKKIFGDWERKEEWIAAVLRSLVQSYPY